MWRERLARFESGNLTVAEFCDREGVSNPSFYQWRKRLKHGDGQSKQRGRTDREDQSSRFLLQAAKKPLEYGLTADSHGGRQR